MHLPTQFVRHFMQRHDGVAADSGCISRRRPSSWRMENLLAPDGLDRERGIQFIIPDELRAVIPQRQDCTPERVKAAMEFLCDEWLVDVATDYTGKATIIAAALTLIERSLLPDRPCFFVTAGRRGGGKTTTLIMLIMAVTGVRPAAAAWSTNEEERRKALMSYFLVRRALHPVGQHRARHADLVPAHREVLHRPRTIPTASSASAKWSAPPPRPSTSSPATISGRGATWLRAACTSASTSTASTPRTGRSSTRTRSAGPRTTAPRSWRRSTPSCWAIPQLKAARDAEGKTRFKMWWRLVGSAVEHAAKLAGQELDFQKLFITQEEDDEESASLADVLDVLVKKWPDQFTASDVAGMINNPSPNEDEQTLREYLLPGALPNHVFSAKSIGKLLKQHLDEPVRSGERTLVLRSWEDKHSKLRVYGVRTITTT